MKPLRRLFLWAQQNEFLRERLPRTRAVQRAVSRFMPGEELADALRAAERLSEDGIASVLTELGENVTTPGEARDVADHYRDVLDRGARREADVEISVKLTHLGLDLGPDVAREHLEGLVRHAREVESFVWVDMESSRYTDVTLELYRHALSESGRVGVCLQAYLYRTAEDLESLLERGGSIRLVKGAYDEPADIAFPRKSDVDDNFLRLAVRMLESGASTGRRHAFGTHDMALVGKIRREAAGRDVGMGGSEVQMLYGIRTEAQRRLAREGVPVRTLISYGSEWYPWYMRRLAERPANVGFILRNVFTG